MYLTVDILADVRAWNDVIFIRLKLCCNFNVSSTKLMHMLDILDKFSMGVTPEFCTI